MISELATCVILNVTPLQRVRKEPQTEIQFLCSKFVIKRLTLEWPKEYLSTHMCRHNLIINKESAVAA